MEMRRITHRFAAWIACFAMLVAALAPSVSHALSMSRGGTWSEICSVGGTKFVKVSLDQGGIADPATQDSIHLEHCPFCATHAGSFALPPNAGFILPLIETQDTHPFLFFQAPHPLAIWTVAQSRAPPASV
ncbi:DUF2946 domain-containing protein [Massilia eurypsychrophila]|nr:DUF2946 domain-containing protein [Massilia eurypsychrophila]